MYNIHEALNLEKVVQQNRCSMWDVLFYKATLFTPNNLFMALQLGIVEKWDLSVPGT